MNAPKSRNIAWCDSYVTHTQRIERNGHEGVVVWFTGLSGSGKSTMAQLVERELFNRGCHCYLLDGDNMRHGLNRDLGFSPEDRTENIRRIGEVANLVRDAGLICHCVHLALPRRSPSGPGDLSGGIVPRGFL